jgi:hypothetical protein
VQFRWVGAMNEIENWWLLEKKIWTVWAGTFVGFAAFLNGVCGKWVRLWWSFGGENVVRCVANVEKKQH